MKARIAGCLTLMVIMSCAMALPSRGGGNEKNGVAKAGGLVGKLELVELRKQPYLLDKDGAVVSEWEEDDGLKTRVLEP